jgi:hypothetical protein
MGRVGIASISCRAEMDYGSGSEYCTRLEVLCTVVAENAPMMCRIFYFLSSTLFL